jgi:hypothetical protein
MHCRPYPPPPPTSRFRNNRCKDDIALFSRFLHAVDSERSSAGILEQSMGARNRVGIGLSYRSAHQAIEAGGIDSLESIPWLPKS